MWIKICGIRDSATASYIASLGVDAIGLNFYAPSPRSVTVDQAAEIANSIRGRITTVGLFVNQAPITWATLGVLLFFGRIIQREFDIVKGAHAFIVERCDAVAV